MHDIIGKFAIIFFGIPLMFYFAITFIAVKMDNTSQSYIDNAVVEFVDNARATAKITPEAYEDMYDKICSAHPMCEVKLIHSAKYVVPGEYDDVTGKYSIEPYMEDFTTDYILEKMYPGLYGYSPDEDYDYILKEGDYIKVTVSNTTPTLGGRLVGLILPSYNQLSLFSSYGGYVGNEAQ